MGSLSFSRSLDEDAAGACAPPEPLRGRSDCDDPGEGLEGGLSAPVELPLNPPFAPPWVDDGPWDAPMEGDRLTRVVFARPKSKGLLVRVGVRCDVERSSAGIAVVGGAGAGRYALGEVTGGADWGSDTGDGTDFFGGGGAAR